MRDVKPPLYGPTGDGTWVQSADVVIRLPPRPPSATYRSPPGPNASPRGLFKPDANTATFGDNPEAAAGVVVAAIVDEANAGDSSRAAEASVGMSARFMVPPLWRGLVPAAESALLQQRCRRRGEVRELGTA